MHICADSSLSHIVMKLCSSLIAGCKSKGEREREGDRERETDRQTKTEIERDCMVLAYESFVLASFLRISKHNVWVNRSILLQLLPMSTNARIQKVLSEGVQLCNSDN